MEKTKTLVIATNNGKNVIGNLINSLNNVGYNGKIAIVDTQSSDDAYMDYLNTLKSDFKNLNISIYQTPYAGRDTGAYVYAIKNIDSDYYYFMQDSMVIKSIEFFEKFDSIIKKGNVAVLVTFPPKTYDSPSYGEFCLKHFGTSEYNKGVFGPTFGASKEQLNKIAEDELIYPTNRTEQEAMERGWSILFDKNGIDIESIEGVYDDHKIRNNGHTTFNKIFPCRP